METSALRTPLGVPWRLRAWSGDPTLGHLVLLDHARLPSDAEIAAALDEAAHRGYRAVRTSALFPPAAEALGRVGFVPVDRLALLRLDSLAHRPLVEPDTRLHPLRAWHRRAAARVDQQAFGAEWGNDADGLTDIERATPRHRSRVVLGGRTRRPAEPIALAISGAAGRTGYLQRIAVTPTSQRQGLASALVADALAWMQSLGLADVLVNTGVANRAALQLYAGFGFVRLADVLTIGEFTFEGDPAR